MILSLDIAFKNLGFILVAEGNIIHCGVLHTEMTKKKNVRVADETADKSRDIALSIKNLVDEYSAEAIIGELPSGGAKSARAMKLMGMATAIIGATAGLLNLPTEFCTPGEVKKALTGNGYAKKMEVIEGAVRLLGLETKYETPPRKRNRKHFTKLCGMWFDEDVFEHIADSIGAWQALKNDNLVRMFG